MSDRPRKLECEAFLEALEATSPEKGTEALPGVLLGLMNEPKRGHAEVCADCRAAVEAMSATRRELARLSEAALEPGPWFTTRVMGAIRAKESEIVPSEAANHGATEAKASSRSLTGPRRQEFKEEVNAG